MVAIFVCLSIAKWGGAMVGESLGGGGKALHRNDNCGLKHPSPPHLGGAKTKMISHHL